MARSQMVLAPALACSALFFMGALTQPPRQAAAAVDTAFVSQPRIGPPNFTHDDPKQLLVRAAATLDPQRVPWLVVKTWQKQVGGEMSFEAEGRLVRGPNHCARLDMTVRASGEPSSVVVVSDGVCLAHACRPAGKRGDVASQRFLSPAKTQLNGPQIEQILNAHGCGGPHQMLKDLAAKLDNIQLDMGLWDGKNVIRLTGSLKAGSTDPSENQLTIRPRLCRVFLDAQTLWPYRVEWWAARQPDEAGQPFLQLEYRDPRVNQPLSHEQCVREFTYVPD